MKLLAISGGPDSMYLLNDYKKANIVVAHVNYNLRTSSKRDQKIVEDFCNKHHIKLKILNVQEKPSKNLENWAREIRYNFFAKIYQKYHCNKLLIAHHKDDFLETAIMQQKANRYPRYFGIRKKNLIKNMHVVRPYINLYWKKEILADLKKKNVPFEIDESNLDLSFSRNNIRKSLLGLSEKEKEDQFKWFEMANKIVVKKFKKVDAFYARWKKQNYELAFFKNLKKYQEELVFLFVHENFEKIKLSSSKIKSIISFINGKDQNKTFILNDENSFLKKDGQLLFYND